MDKEPNNYKSKFVVQRLVLPKCSTIQQASGLYYRKYLQLYHENRKLNEQLAVVLSQRNELATKYNEIKSMKSNDEIAKRRRRFANQIERKFRCPYESCERSYGTQGSLTHHVRLKHLSYYKSGKYEIFLENFIASMKKDSNQ